MPICLTVPCFLVQTIYENPEVHPLSHLYPENSRFSIEHLQTDAGCAKCDPSQTVGRRSLAFSHSNTNVTGLVGRFTGGQQSTDGDEVAFPRQENVRLEGGFGSKAHPLFCLFFFLLVVHLRNIRWLCRQWKRKFEAAAMDL